MTIAALFFATLVDAPAPPVREPLPAPAMLQVVSTRQGMRWSSLPSVRFVDGGTGEACDVHLYDDEGRVDPNALATLAHTLRDVRRAGDHREHELDPRLVQVVVRAALHFGVREVAVVSAFRSPGRYTEGNHAHGKAIDFSLPGVERKDLAAYLRAHPRLGVGEYVHKRTQYVHVDVREASYHWIDGTPPGRPGWGSRLSLEGLPALDASWTPGPICRRGEGLGFRERRPCRAHPSPRRDARDPPRPAGGRVHGRRLMTCAFMIPEHNFLRMAVGAREASSAIVHDRQQVGPKRREHLGSFTHRELHEVQVAGHGPRRSVRVIAFRWSNGQSVCVFDMPLPRWRWETWILVRVRWTGRNQ